MTSSPEFEHLAKTPLVDSGSAVGERRLQTIVAQLIPDHKLS